MRRGAKIIEINEWKLCAKCEEKIQKSTKKSLVEFKKNERFFKNFKNSLDFELGIHAFEKADLKNIDINDEKEKALATKGEVIEIQTGKFKDEFKFIVLQERNGEPLHYIFLKRPDVAQPSLINVYNPREGMSFKWSEDSRRRVYLNSFRTCCRHPEDDESNFNKAHHGKNHGLYDYQKKN